MSRLELQVEGTRFTGFQRGTYQASMDSITSGFDIEYVVASDKRPLLVGDKVLLLLDNKILVDGWVESTGEDDLESEIRLRATGRTVTGDLADCTAPRKQYRNRLVSEIVKDLCAPYFIPVVVEGDEGERIANYATQDSQIVGDAIVEVCKKRGLYAFSLEEALVLAQPGSRRTQTNLVRGIPPLMRTERTHSHYERFSEYHFNGSLPGRPGRRKKKTRISTVLQDQEVARYRPTVLSVPTDGPGDLQTRAAVLRNQTIGRSETIKVLVAGHTTREGYAWRPNLIVSLMNDVVGASGDYIVSTVRMVFGEREPDQTELELMRPQAYETGYFPPEKKRRRGL